MSSAGSQNVQPISSIASSGSYRDRMKYSHNYNGDCSSDNQHSWAYALFVFIIFVIIIWVILWVLKPEFLTKDDHHRKDCEVDGGKALIWAIVIALLILFVVWIIAAAVRYGGSGYGHKKM